MEIQLQYDDLTKLLGRLERTGRDIQPMLKRIHTRVGKRVFDRARRYAPISPTVADRKSVSKASKAQWAAAAARKSPTATSRATPGALQNSIELLATSTLAQVFVPTNSPAGAYAWKIHEEKGKTWQNRGVGTVKKGPQADEKFIERAIKDSELDLVAIIEDETRKVRDMI